MRPSKPESGQMMKVARTVENEFAEMRLNLAIKLFDYSGRSGETKPRTPFRGISCRQTVRNVAPGAVEIEMKGIMICVHHSLWPRFETRCARPSDAHVFRETWIKLQRFKSGDPLHVEERRNYSPGSSQNQRSGA